MPILYLIQSENPSQVCFGPESIQQSDYGQFYLWDNTDWMLTEQVVSYFFVNNNGITYNITVKRERMHTFYGWENTEFYVDSESGVTLYQM